MRRRIVLLVCAVPLVLVLACIRDDGGTGEEDPALECAFFARVEAPEPRTEPDWDKASRSLFDETTIPEVRIAFSPSERQALEAIWKDPKWEDPANAELWEVEKADAWVRCSVAVGPATFAAEAACRVRGSPEDWHLEKKPQLKVKFNKWDESKRFLGMRSFNLEHMRYTAAPVRDRIAMWMFREAGLPAARVNHVHVFIDGEDRGAYQVIEPIDREFLESWFANPDGNLYEGGYVKETNEDVRDECDAETLNDIVEGEPLGGDHAEFVAAFSEVADEAQFIRVLAAEAVFPAVDNFVNGSTNFYYYHHPGQGFVVITWDHDSVLVHEYDVITPTGGAGEHGRFYDLVQEIPAWKKAFEDALVEIRDGPFKRLHQKTDEVCNQVRDLVIADEAWTTDWRQPDFDDECAEIHRLIDVRIEYLKGRLGR